MSTDDSSRSNTVSASPAGRSNGLIDRLRTLLGLKPSASTIREDLEDALTGAQVLTPDFTPEERAMLKNVLGLRGLRVDDVMVPRPDIISVPSASSIGEVLDIFRSAEHSRLPVYGETLDEPLGIVHIKDLLAHMTAQAVVEADAGARGSYDFTKVDLSQILNDLDIVRQVLYVPPSMPAIDLLAQMQATRVHMALVIDEYGGTDGLVTIEDLVEMVVGDIEDEHDEDAVVMIQPVGDGFIADARVALEEVEAMLGIDFKEEDAADDVDTLGGLLVTLAGRVPVRGEIVSGPSELEFEVLDADPRRIKRVRIVRRVEPIDAMEARSRGQGRASKDNGAEYRAEL
ncbi:hemolysin [Agaricicola taiwanensis]|uniref:Hemolysin n=1 Tax=Agaricicola taiwanensis TaxID=591372 RepID=A0A8J2VGA9_9RHOB|nr:hemolysin family protein [Agaricicola taiwanensis]GGE29213.1 hemolysin [Agaricicola taiwanensis]